MYVIIDTCTIHLDFYLSNPTTQALLKLAHANNLVVCVAEVIVQEMLADFKKAITEDCEALTKARDELAKHLPRRKVPRFRVDIDGAVTEYDKRFRAKLRQSGVQVLPLPSVSVHSLLRRAIEHRKPFKEKGSAGMPDALLWESIVELKRQHPTEQLALITANTADFADTTGNYLHPDLLHELGATPIEARELRGPAELNMPIADGEGQVMPEFYKSIKYFYDEWCKRVAIAK